LAFSTIFSRVALPAFDTAGSPEKIKIPISQYNK